MKKKKEKKNIFIILTILFAAISVLLGGYILCEKMYLLEVKPDRVIKVNFNDTETIKEKEATVKTSEIITEQSGSKIIIPKIVLKNNVKTENLNVLNKSIKNDILDNAKSLIYNSKYWGTRSMKNTYRYAIKNNIVFIFIKTKQYTDVNTKSSYIVKIDQYFYDIKNEQKINTPLEALNKAGYSDNDILKLSTYKYSKECQYIENYKDNYCSSIKFIKKELLKNNNYRGIFIKPTKNNQVVIVNKYLQYTNMYE